MLLDIDTTIAVTNITTNTLLVDKDKIENVNKEEAIIDTIVHIDIKRVIVTNREIEAPIADTIRRVAGGMTLMAQDVITVSMVVMTKIQTIIRVIILVIRVIIIIIIIIIKASDQNKIKGDKDQEQDHHTHL